MPKDLPKDKSGVFRDMVVAHFERFGETYEILVKPDIVQQIRDGKKVDLVSALPSDEIFRDVKKGTRASAEKMQEIFGTEDRWEVARQLILKGDIQVTTEQRRAMQEKKRKQIVTYIAQNAFNPQTGAPHPPGRIETAIAEARIPIDPFKGVEEQVKDILEALRPLLPIRFDKVKIAVKLRAEDSPRCYGDIKGFGKILQEEWQGDGSWVGMVEMPAGMQTDFFEMLNAKTRGAAETRVVR